MSDLVMTSLEPGKEKEEAKAWGAYWDDEEGCWAYRDLDVIRTRRAWLFPW